MEGKGVLFKRFAGIDVFDLELDCEDPAQFVETVERLQGGFGGINLEDISAPACFEIERELKARCEIPVMHDDQHGAAIISGAALLSREAMPTVWFRGGPGSIRRSFVRPFTLSAASREPVVAVVSHSNFGSARNAESELPARLSARSCLRGVSSTPRPAHPVWRGR